MSDPRISAISESLGGAPEDLVERSAAARAQAEGASVDDVLSSWSGGGELPQSDTTTDAAPTTDTAPEPDAPPAAAPTLAAPAPAAVLVATEVVEEPAETVEPAGLADRVRVGGKAGAIVGGLLAIIAILAASPMLLRRLTLPSGEATPAIEVTSSAAVLAIAGMSLVFGIVVTLTVRTWASFVSPAYDVSAGRRGALVLGAFNGVVLGFLGGGVLIGTAETTLTDTKLLPVRSFVFSLIVGGIILGAIAGALAHAMAQPAQLSGEAASDADVVKRRLSDSLAIPAVSGVLILIIVVSFGSLLVQYPVYAPWLAILVAIGILAFASMMAARPNLRIGKGEVLAAAAGVAVILLMLALIAAQTSGGGHATEDEGSHAMDGIVSQ